ncbi:MAG: hypothetical protein A2Z96_07720 [Spirochaetes bacterium GWB1_48_6]|nr:MAG: hypothetical protein A2Z96_07720 [Spirochaetes bacterium GWB1_48_6]
MATTIINHPGIVLGWDKDRLRIQIVTGGACGACSAKGSCPGGGSSENKETEVLAIPEAGQEYNPWDRVTVSMTASQGFTAVWWAFVLPLFLLLGTIFTLQPLIKNESLVALAGLMVLGLSWAALALLKKYFEKQFVFRARRAP